MRLEDSKAVHAIEQDVMDSPWSLQQIADEVVFKSGVQLVAVDDAQRITGYLFLRYCGVESELLRIGVAALQQNKSIGSVLLMEGVQILNEKKVAFCNLEVRVSNNQSQRFYLKHRFVHTGVRPKYYRDPVEDAVLMQMDLRTYPGGECENAS